MHQDFEHLDLFSPGRIDFDGLATDWMYESIENYNIPPYNFTYYLTKQTNPTDEHGETVVYNMGDKSTTPPLYMQYIWD